jgi:hypothetical protein
MRQRYSVWVNTQENLPSYSNIRGLSDESHELFTTAMQVL